MRDSNIKAISINRVIHEKINMDSAVSKNYHRISPNNLRRSLRRTRTNTLIFSENEFESLFIYTSKIIEENESLPIEKQSFILNIKGPDFETNPLDFFWAYSTPYMKKIGTSTNEWNIDATYQILKCKKGLWIISCKDLSNHVFPILFFITPDETAHSLSFVLELMSKENPDFPYFEATLKLNQLFKTYF